MELEGTIWIRDLIRDILKTINPSFSKKGRMGKFENRRKKVDKKRQERKTKKDRDGIKSRQKKKKKKTLPKSKQN